MNVQSLSDDERMFLAGCIKNIILAAGSIEREELSELDDIIDSFQFDDFDAQLERFENDVHDEETFWELAGDITNEKTQETILQILDELAIQDGLVEQAEQKLLDKLRQFWNM